MSGGNKVKLPMQLVSLIQSQEQGLMDEGYLLSLASPETTAVCEAAATNDDENQHPKVATSHQKHHPPTKVVMASHSKFLKELQSYTRVVCMRLGFA